VQRKAYLIGSFLVRWRIEGSSPLVVLSKEK
jgi:hypothetical protein